MKKRWLVGGLCLAVLAGAGVAVMTGVLSLPGGSARAKADGASPAEGSRGERGDKKPEVALEFVQQEVVQPKLARLPGVVEFSGPLVAPQTALVRAKASGTLLALSVAEGSRVQAGQTLGRIELAELNTRVAERNAMLESARATLVQAERRPATSGWRRSSSSRPTRWTPRARRWKPRAPTSTPPRPRWTPPRSACVRPRCSRPSRASWPSATCCRAKRSVSSSNF